MTLGIASLASSNLARSALEGSPSQAYGACPESRLGTVPREFESRTLRFPEVHGGRVLGAAPGRHGWNSPL